MISSQEAHRWANSVLARTSEPVLKADEGNVGALIVILDPVVKKARGVGFFPYGDQIVIAPNKVAYPEYLIATRRGEHMYYRQKHSKKWLLMPRQGFEGDREAAARELLKREGEYHDYSPSSSWLTTLRTCL